MTSSETVDLSVSALGTADVQLGSQIWAKPCPWSHYVNEEPRWAPIGFLSWEKGKPQDFCVERPSRGGKTGNSLPCWYASCLQRLCVEEDGSGARWMSLDLILRALKALDLGDHQRMGCV